MALEVEVLIGGRLPTIPVPQTPTAGRDEVISDLLHGFPQFKRCQPALGDLRMPLHITEQAPCKQASVIAIAIVTNRNYDASFTAGGLQGTIDTDRQGLLGDPALTQLADSTPVRHWTKEEPAPAEAKLALLRAAHGS